MSELTLLSERAYQKWPSYFVVYEWEDIFERYGFKIHCLKDRSKFEKIWLKISKKFLNFHVKTFDKADFRFVWVMNACDYKAFCKLKAIPIFLDFPTSMVDYIAKATKELPFFWVTCLDIYDLLASKGVKNVHYMPLSVSDDYLRKTIPAKKHDVIQFGRKNPVLHDYMIRYCHENPSIEYIYQIEGLRYFSTTKGDLGKFDTRSSYMELISECKVSLVSSPGKDNSRNFGGVDFITPRFYESAALYCHLIGRYTPNKEAIQIGLPSICPNVQSYEEFKTLITNYLLEKSFNDKAKYDLFLEKNTTSARVNSVLEIIDSVM